MPPGCFDATVTRCLLPENSFSCHSQKSSPDPALAQIARRPGFERLLERCAPTPHWKRWRRVRSGLTRQHFGRIDAAFRAAVPVQRMHQQLQILRFLARQPDPARHAAGGTGRHRSAAPRRRGVSQHSAGGGRTSEIRVQRLSRSVRARRARGSRRARAFRWRSGRWKRTNTGPLVAAGAEGLVVYQETYHRPTYEEMHTAGPKRDFDWRLDCPERAYAAGFRRLGHRRALRLARLARGSRGAGRARRLPAAPLLEGARHRQPAAAAAGGGGFRAALFVRRPRSGAASLRVAADFPAGRSRALHARGPRPARRPDPARASLP